MRLLRPGTVLRRSLFLSLCAIAFYYLAPAVMAQSASYERTFPQTKAQIKRALKDLQSEAAGHLPTLDGFASAGDSPLDRFQRGYYQCIAEVGSLPSGESRVRVSAKITAWYVDPAGSKSGYQMLPSNGRLESDFLDRLQETLQKLSAAKAPASTPVVPKSEKKAPASADTPTISAPMPQDTVPGEPIARSGSTPSSSSPFKTGSSADELAATRNTNSDKQVEDLTKEAKNLEEILHNQSHPTNLIAVKKSSTPVYGTPSEGAQVLFLATAEDEFEMLDMNASWVHIRISGLSRGWILRDAVEMPEESAGEQQPATAPAHNQTPSESTGKSPFQIESEQIASFPGDWGPLRGKTVKIVSVQQAGGTTNSRTKLAYAKSVFDREYSELKQTSSTAAGVVVVFDSADGGMMAATLPVLQEWKTGTISDEALWRRCFFDPPELFRASTTP